MARTADRPVASGRVSPRAAIAFGVLLGCASFALLALTVNPLAAALSLSGLLGYVLVYTLWLKRTTPQNIVIGGAAGAGAAATDRLGGGHGPGSSGTALYLFAIVFFWTPPHFWALSLLMKDEYAKAGVPMLPVVRGEDETRRQILLYTVLLYAVTQLPFCAGGFGVAYLVASMTLGAIFIYCAVRLLRSAERRWAPAHLPLLARLPGAALRGRCRSTALVLDRNPAVDRETARANMGRRAACRRHCGGGLRPRLPRRGNALHRQS